MKLHPSKNYPMHYFFALLLTLFVTRVAIGQTGAASLPSPSLPLPPSMQAEMKQARSKITKTIVFRDTVKGSSRAREFMNDSTKPEGYVPPDSALSVVDSGVSLTHKEWLDSLLIELPEISYFGQKIHFSYPMEIMTETLRKPVPFDTTILRYMNPVSRENLPYFDQSPIPLPLTPSRPYEAFLELGGGAPILPYLQIGGGVTTSERFGLDALIDYQGRSTDNPIRTYYSGDLRAKIGLSGAQSDLPFQSTIMHLDLTDQGRKTLIHLDTGSTTHTASVLKVGADLAGDNTERFHYQVNASYSGFADNYGKSLSESTIEAGVDLIRHFMGLGVDAQLNGAFKMSNDLDLNASVPLHDSAHSSVSLQHYTFAVGQRNQPSFDWLLGAGVGLLSDATGSRVAFLPVGRIRIPLNPRWEIGAAFEPQAYLMNAQWMNAKNPFFTLHQSNVLQDSGTAVLDPRRAAVDNINLQAFMNYQLWTDDQIRTSVQFIERKNELLFFERTLASGENSFYVEPRDTRRLIVSGGASFLLFLRDVVTADVEYRSATIAESDASIPFEPTLRFSAAYLFNSLADWLRPRVEFSSISRKDRSLSFLNAEIHSEVSSKLAILLRVENLLGGPSDYWTSYDERPRSVLATVRYRF